MDKTKNIFVALVSLFFLSGCSLVSNSLDGGVFRSDDGGKKFSQKATIDEKTKISSIDVLSMAVNPQNGSELYIGTKSNGIFKSNDSGEKWEVVKVAEESVSKVYAISFDRINPSIIFVAAVVGGRGKILKSVDSRVTWKEVYTEAANGSAVTALEGSFESSGKIFGGTTKGQIIFSDNGGDSWSNLHQAQGPVSKIAFDSIDSKLVYFLISQSGILKTKDEGKNFESLGSGSTFGSGQQLGLATDISSDPFKNGWIYAGTNSGLYQSKDGGGTWELVKVLNSPKENAIRGIAINPQNSDEIIYGAAQAFYKSLDGGKSWSTTQFSGSRSIEISAYNKQSPGVIYAGMNKR